MVDREGLAWLERSGIRSLSPDEATFTLGRLWRAPDTVVANIDWPLFRELFEARGRSRFFETLDTGADRSVSTAAATETRERLAGLPADARRSALSSHVQEAVVGVLGWRGAPPELRASFFDIGMDSLTALELKNRLQASLGLTLRATAVFNHPTMASLAEYLDTLIAAPAQELGGADLDALTEDELARLLDAQISAVDSEG